jgi:hypothetical protein
MAWRDSTREKFFYAVKDAMREGVSPAELIRELEKCFYVVLDEGRAQNMSSQQKSNARITNEHLREIAGNLLSCEISEFTSCDEEVEEIIQRGVSILRNLVKEARNGYIKGQ